MRIPVPATLLSNLNRSKQISYKDEKRKKYWGFLYI